jgi:serine/threonine protein kinase
VAEASPQGLCARCLLEAGLKAVPSSWDSRQETSAASTPPADAGPIDPAQLSRLFPQLDILRLLGRGGMGAVYLARQKALDRLVAVKLLAPKPGLDAEFAERFGREARALARLNHPGIVGVYDFGSVEGLYFFLMEYVDGMSLREVMGQGHLEPRQAMALIPHICDALQYAHDEGVIHRDIKPENILIDKKGRIKIADFGLVKLLGTAPELERLTGSHHVMGTRNYMAPEQLEHPRAVDHRADIYSLGVVFYEMLTGELPLGRFAPPSQKVQVDVRLDEVVLHSLEKAPERRYQHASEVKTDVERLDGVLPTPRGTVSPPKRTSRWLIVVPALVVVAFAVWALLSRGRSRTPETVVSSPTPPALLQSPQPSASPVAAASAGVGDLEIFTSVVRAGDSDSVALPVARIPKGAYQYVLPTIWVRWNPNLGVAGKHDLEWRFYRGESLYATRQGGVVAAVGRSEGPGVVFTENPTRIYRAEPADGLEIGRYRIDVAIDGKVMDKLRFDVVPVASGDTATAGSVACEASPEELTGKWKDPEGRYTTEIARQGDRYVMFVIVEGGGPLPKPRPFGEFRATSQPCAYRGRHVWGGEDGQPATWAMDGAMTVEQLSKKSIFVRFLDSRYTGGWIYVRISGDVDAAVPRFLVARAPVAAAARSATAVPSASPTPSLGVDKMQAVSAMVTSGSPDGKSHDSRPLKQIPQDITFYTVNWMRWDPSIADAGAHDIEWRYYLGDGLRVVRKDPGVLFKLNPRHLQWSQPAAGFEVGHYRVDILIDGKVVDKVEFDVVPAGAAPIAAAETTKPSDGRTPTATPVVPPLSVDQLEVFNGMVTTGDNKSPGTRPMKEIPLHTMVYTIIRTRWNPALGAGAGVHSVEWRFYSGARLYQTRISPEVNFDSNPGRWWWRQPSDGFEIGHYDVDVLIDGKSVYKLAFDIVPEMPIPTPGQPK